MLLPIACRWAEKHEAVILRDGVALMASQVADARQIGVAHPERVRLRVVEKVPPLHPLLRKVAEATGLISPLIGGMTLRYGIFIKSESWGDRRMIIHELAHTLQYERFGGFRPFLEKYLYECMTLGYPFGPLEQEAKRIERALCG